MKASTQPRPEAVAEAIADFLKTSGEEKKSLQKAQSLTEVVDRYLRGSDPLKHYRAVRKRMVGSNDIYFEPPNFTYTLHAR